ncbi:G-type lectin S-receptor-like serine/threonine-protein kinase At1g11410 isoform X2 [Papaver somniferum]|uniref:G-type lectin S-receptor-like serine/threonine-protein kinase At1g11410 isoform X2 n=1 Tax=Papaver somniferum TaxID=3469 RepID=UPI000E7043A3|nr:G-type lectin S-receptor-like serine/threonine-protein kinase At1g11410 isoform X2 [Papaver somniferum]
MDAIRNNSGIFLCVVLFSFAMCSKPHHIIAADTISSGDSLTGNQTIISKRDRFVLGFFRPASRTLNTTQVVLGDDGNLVLRDGSNPSVVIWQSFDYPAYTWLPGAKIGFNKKTNQSQTLTSWRSREDPAMGLYSFESGPSGTSQYALYWNNSIIYWNSGEWHEKSKFFVSAPEMRLNYIFNYSCVSNVNESYFTYSLYNNSIISRFVMDFTGRVQQLTWSQTTQRWDLFWSVPKRPCEAFGNCGPFGYCNQDTWSCECLPGFVPRSPPDWSLQDSTGGCVRSTPLKCRSKDSFSPVPVSNLPIPRFDQRMLTAEICKSACEDTCSCYAYAFDYGCELWEDGDIINLINITSSRTPQLFYLRRAATKIYSLSPVSSSLEPVSTFEVRKSIVWKIVVPVFLLVGVSGYIYLFKRNKANKRGSLKGLHGVLTDLLKFNPTYNGVPIANMFDDGKTKGETQDLQIFNLACLANATNNFSLKNKLGEGGFGPVYKGKLPNEKEIAVKRLSKSSGQGIEEFKNEVLLISKLQHRNLVKLLGCCVEGEEYMLIYEYMSKGSLDAFLFDPKKKAQLDWDKRFNIIGGIAHGLLYLHRDSRLRVIHRDLKVSNILLDENMNPKISDFGMARIFGGDQAIDNTNRVVGTFGYMSPEYITKGTFSEKSDVFSFGVLILEIVSSKSNNSFDNPEQPLDNLLLHTWRLWSEGKWSEVVDEGLGDLYCPIEVMKCVHIGLLCVQNGAINRPTMAEVDFMLTGETDRPIPKEPPYTFTTSSDKPGSSNNNVTLSSIEGR